MPYASGPYHAHSSLPVQARPLLVSARSINFKLKRYEIDSVTGGYTDMNVTAQRVVLLVSFALVPWRFLTDQDNEQTRQAIITALEPLTKATPPEVDQLLVAVTRERAGVGKVDVEFNDTTTGQNVTLQLT